MSFWADLIVITTTGETKISFRGEHWISNIEGIQTGNIVAVNKSEHGQLPVAANRYFTTHIGNPIEDALKSWVDMFTIYHSTKVNDSMLSIMDTQGQLRSIPHGELVALPTSYDPFIELEVTDDHTYYAVIYENLDFAITVFDSEGNMMNTFTYGKCETHIESYLHIPSRENFVVSLRLKQLLINKKNLSDYDNVLTVCIDSDNNPYFKVDKGYLNCILENTVQKLPISIKEIMAFLPTGGHSEIVLTVSPRQIALYGHEIRGYYYARISVYLISSDGDDIPTIVKPIYGPNNGPLFQKVQERIHNKQSLVGITNIRCFKPALHD